MSYQGHKNWNHWNVSLWIHNDEGFYRRALEAVRMSATLDIAAEELAREFPRSTPDGAPYTKTAIRAALRGLLS